MKVAADCEFLDLTDAACRFIRANPIRGSLDGSYKRP